MPTIQTSLHGSKAGLTAQNDLVLQNVVTGQTEIVARAPGNLVAPAAGATLTVTPDAHLGKTIPLTVASGQAVTLPNATGTGHKYRFAVLTTVTSNTTTIKVARAADVMAGLCIQAADGGNTVAVYETASDTDTITLDGSTRGGIRGDIIELEDVAPNLYLVNIMQAATGTEATPFSATVS